MSIKQGDYLKELRLSKGLSQEKLSEVLGISRQSVSKWEQGLSSPDIDNVKKLSEFFGVSADSILHGESDIMSNPPVQAETAPEEKPEKEKRPKKKRGWLFSAYPVLAVIAYCLIGVMFSPKGWYIGWTVLLTIPLFYTGIIAAEKRKPIIFCYPVLVVMIFVLCGLCFGKWHPAWILFLTIPVFYIITAKMTGRK